MVEILLDLEFTYMFVDELLLNNWPEFRLKLVDSNSEFQTKSSNNEFQNKSSNSEFQNKNSNNEFQEKDVMI